MSNLLKNIIRLILLFFLQVVILNRINLAGYLNPYLYILFILLLPFETPKWAMLVISFLTGLGIDAFSNSYGLHAAACTLMAFARPGVLQLITSKKEYEPGLNPGIRDLGVNWFLSYSILLVLVHHSCLYFMEVFRFGEFFYTLWRIMLNSFVTLLLIMLSQYLFYNRKKRV